LGFENEDGSVGTKNVFAISTSVQCVAGMGDVLVKKIENELLPKYPNVDAVCCINHAYGCGIAIDAPAAVVPIRTLKNIATNPNFGGEIMVLGLGCEKLRPERFVEDADKGMSQSIFYLQDKNNIGFQNMLDAALEVAEKHLKKLNNRRRVPCGIDKLIVGMQCGGSDSFSGITANPVAGYAADLIIRAGGTVIFSETTEVRDAAKTLIDRTISKELAEKLIYELEWYDNYLKNGEVNRSSNTTPGNIKGGLSNIVEKSLGSVAKSGTSPIVDVLSPGEKVKTKGLNFLSTPASDFVCGTLQLAAGINMHLFMTGRGSPYGLKMVPVIKISSNSDLKDRWHDLIDFDAGKLLSQETSLEAMGWSLFELILRVASGEELVASDKLGLYNDLVLFNPGPLT